MEAKGRRWDSLEARVVRSFLFGGKEYRAVLERRLLATGVYRGQHQILMCIGWNPDVSQKELAKISHVSTAAMAVSLKKLEKGGYIERAVDSDDNRFHKIRLTEKGRLVVENSESIFLQTEETMLNGFTDEEKEQFLVFLERTRTNMGTMLQKSDGRERQET